MAKKSKFTKVLAIIVVLGMILSLLPMSIMASVETKTINADEKYRVHKSSGDSASIALGTTIRRYDYKQYYIFRNVGLEEVTSMLFTASYSNTNSGGLQNSTLYVGEDDFPTEVTSDTISAWISNATGKKTSTARTSAIDSVNEKVNLQFDDLTMQNGSTVVVYVTNGGDSKTYIGGSPTLTFDYEPGKVLYQSLTINDYDGTQVSDTAAVPVYSTYTIKIASTEVLDDAKIAEVISLKDASDNVIPIEITTTSTQKGLLNFYECVVKTPVLAATTEHRLEILKDLNDTTQIETISFTTGAAPVLDEAVTDAAAQSSEFVAITAVEPERINQNFLIDTGIKNAPVFAAIVKKTDVAPVDEKITMTNQEIAEKAIYSDTFTSDISTGKIEFTWVVDDTIVSTDYVLLVERNFGLGDAYFEFYYKNPLQQDAVMAILNGTSVTNPNCSREAFQTTLFDNAKLLGIDSTEYDALTSTTLADGGKSKVIDRLFVRRTQIIDEASLNDLFGKAVEAQQIENIDAADDLKQMITSDVAKYGIDASVIYQTTYLATLPQYQISEALVFEEMSKYDVDWITDVKDLFEVSALKTALTNVGNYRLSYDILSSVNTVLGIDFTEYERRGNNKDQVLSIFVTSVTSAVKLSDIATIFNSAVSQVGIPVQTTTPSYGGGGGGGGGSTPSRGGGGGVTAPSRNTEKLEVTPSTQASEKAAFSDLEESHWASDYIKRLNQNGYISGYDDGTFRANNYITRGEFVTIITKAFALETGENTCHFMDVPEDNWAYPYIAAAYSRGIVNGINHDFFIPDRSISRQDAAVIIANLYKYLGIETESNNAQFTDEADIADYAQNAMGYLAKSGIINGYEDGSARPEANITRAETCKVISEAIDHRWTVSNN